MNALSLGVEPIRAAGYSAAVWFVLLAELTFVTGGYRSLGDVPHVYLFFLASALTCSVVFLWDNWRQHKYLSSEEISMPLWKNDNGTDLDMVWKHADVPLKFESDNDDDTITSTASTSQ